LTVVNDAGPTGKRWLPLIPLLRQAGSLAQLPEPCAQLCKHLPGFAVGRI